MRPGWIALLAVAGVAASAGTARGQDYPDITDRDYGLDLYTGGAIGSVRIVGMGGTTIAVGEGSPGTIANPAAAAVRRTTSQGNWDWDFHLDGMSEIYQSDFDNNGFTGTHAFDTTIGSAGLAGMLEGFGLAVVGTWATTQIDADANPATGDDVLEARATQVKMALAKEFLRQEWTVGVGLRLGTFEIVRAEGARRTGLFSISGGGLEAGGLWRPPMTDWRVGASISFPVTGTSPEIQGCDPMDCEGYILPERIEVPWVIAGGVAYRWAPTRWNQRLPTIYRDERAVLLAADVVLTGAVPDAYGLEKFGEKQLQPSGRSTVVSVRAGAEYEALPGRLRVRGGSYWEPGRFADVDGRIHGTLGLEVSLFQFKVWRWTYRLRISGTGDVAVRYFNVGASIGFWH
jgi:hypothetical protein